MRHRLLITALCYICFVVGITAQDGGRQSLTVFAATSLTDAFESLREAFIETNPDVEVQLNFSSSSTLAAQLLQGAPADIFASANETQMAIVVEGGIIAKESVATFAHNELVLITPAVNPAGISAVEDLSTRPVLLVLAAQGTPIRGYTDAMFASHNDELGEGFADQVLLNLASEESNVRLVVTRIALGEADAGIVYRTDTVGDIAEQLITIEIDPAHNQLASYPIGALSTTANLPLATEFINFVLSQYGQEIFRDYGFCSPAILTGAPPADLTPEPTLEATATEESDAPSSPCQASPGSAG